MLLYAWQGVSLQLWPSLYAGHVLLFDSTVWRLWDSLLIRSLPCSEGAPQMTQPKRVKERCFWRQRTGILHGEGERVYGNGVRESFIIPLPPQRRIRGCKDGRRAQAEDRLGSHSSGTSKPEAFTVSIPQSHRHSLWCAERERAGADRPASLPNGDSALVELSVDT